MCSFTLYHWFLLKIDLFMLLAYAYVANSGEGAHPKRQRDRLQAGGILIFARFVVCCPNFLRQTKNEEDYNNGNMIALIAASECGCF